MSVYGVPGGEADVPFEDNGGLTGLDAIEGPDEFLTAFGPGILEGSEDNVPAWERDLNRFAASHQSAVINSARAYYNPSNEALNAANEAIALASKNSMALMDREYFRDSELKTPKDTTPLDETLSAMAGAIHEWETSLGGIYPERIVRDMLSLEELEQIAKDTRGDDSTSDEDALKRILGLSTKYGELCKEMEGVLKLPRIANAAKQKSETVSASGGANTPRDWRKELTDLSLAGVALFGATALANLITRPKKS